MKTSILYPIVMLLIALVTNSCGNKPADAAKDMQGTHEGHDEEGPGELHLTGEKLEKLGVKIDSLTTRVLYELVEANGRLEVPPQHEASVTAIVGANVTSIRVIEGDKIARGQTLAYLAHPNLTNLQTSYVKAYSSLQYLEKEKDRQQRLHEEEIASGKAYQKTLADYLSMKGEVRGYEVQLKQLGLNVDRIATGNIYETIPVTSPIDGYVELVNVKVGQYVDPQSEMFLIVNTEHVHADLMVFEKDVYKVKKGQEMTFTIESVPGKVLTAKIYSVGKQFEQNPRAVHVHAEIAAMEEFLIPGMYINGKIRVNGKPVRVLPEDAIVEDGGKTWVFLADRERTKAGFEWGFKPVEVRTGLIDAGWVEVIPVDSLPEDALFAWNNAYYLIAEMQKSLTSHSH